ncbi:suppressor of cytokine signaling 1 [Pogona vitticeps]
MVAHSSLTPENGIATELRSRREPPSAAAARAPRQAQPSHRHGPPGCGQAPRDTHFHTFRSQEDFNAIIRASALLEECGFYWGPLSVNMAHEKLKGEPVGTFLLRDSRQKNCFFTVSVKTATGPTSIRIIFQAGRFHLDGSHETFDCLFKLLEHYAGIPQKVLVSPLPKRRLRSLQELCRRTIVATAGRENLSHIPLNPVLKGYLESFPFKF